MYDIYHIIYVQRSELVLINIRKQSEIQYDEDLHIVLSGLQSWKCVDLSMSVLQSQFHFRPVQYFLLRNIHYILVCLKEYVRISFMKESRVDLQILLTYIFVMFKVNEQIIISTPSLNTKRIHFIYLAVSHVKCKSAQYPMKMFSWMQSKFQSLEYSSNEIELNYLNESCSILSWTHNTDWT